MKKLMLFYSVFCFFYVSASKGIYIRPSKIVVFLDKQNSKKYGESIEFKDLDNPSLALLNIKHKSEITPLKSVCYYFESGEVVKFEFLRDSKINIVITYKWRTIKVTNLTFFKFELHNVYLSYLSEGKKSGKIKPMFKSKYFYVGFNKSGDYLGVNSMLFQKRKYRGIGILPN